MKLLSLALVALPLVAGVSGRSSSSSAPARPQPLDLLLATESGMGVITQLAAGEHVITVEGDGSTDLDGFILDSQGNEIVSSTDLSDSFTLRFSADEAGTYVVSVFNAGQEANRFSLSIQ